MFPISAHTNNFYYSIYYKLLENKTLLAYVDDIHEYW